MTTIVRLARTHVFLTMLLAIIGGSLAAVSINTSVANGSSGEVRNVQEQGWGYALHIKDSKLVMVTISYDTHSAAGIEAYAAAQRQENRQLFRQGTEVKAVSLVFNHTLTWDEADAFVTKYGIYASGYDLHGVNNADPTDIYSLGIGLVRDGKNPQRFNDGMREAAQQHEAERLKNVTIKGISGMQVNLTENQYAQVSADPNVYLVEMVQQVVQAKIANGLPALKDIHRKTE